MYARLLIIGLRPYTWYDMYVQPFRRNVNGASSTIVRERTSHDGILTLFPCYFHLCGMAISLLVFAFYIYTSCVCVLFCFIWIFVV